MVGEKEAVKVQLTVMITRGWARPKQQKIHRERERKEKKTLPFRH